MKKKLLTKILDLFGLKIMKSKSFYKLKNSLSSLPKFIFLWNNLNNAQKLFISPYLHLSKSQNAQDLFVISELLNRKLPNYFIEFGAASGLNLSNTYLLEKYFSWSGILAEPAKIWHNELCVNRKCIIDKRCVYKNTGEKIEFMETSSKDDIYKKTGPELSSLKIFHDSGDWASKIRKNNSISYFVETVSLNDLLLQNNAPFHIGYLSIDTEGGEFEILHNFDFNKYKIEIISIEHNSDNNKRNLIFLLMNKKGYKRVYDDIFGGDDIYVLDNENE